MPDDRTIRKHLKSQYHAALEMVRTAVEKCPDRLWYDQTPTNAFWQVAYHTVFFAHLYVQQNEAAFQPWPGQQSDVQHPDAIPGRVDPGSALPLIPAPYSRAQVLAYCDYCHALLDDAVDALDLEAPDSGFHWYKASKFEHQLVNLRHIQHHAAQLADRLRAELDIGIPWVGGWSSKS